VADQDADVMSKALIDDAVTVGHHDLCTASRLEVKTSKPRGGVVDEVVSGARVEKGCELPATHQNAQLHGCDSRGPGDGVQGDERWAILLSHGCCCWIVVVGVGHLQVEEARALVPTDIRLVTIEAESLAASLGHLCWGETAKCAWRCCC